MTLTTQTAGAGVPIVITGVTLIDGDSDRPLDNRSIWIEGGRIKAIARQSEMAPPSGAIVIDGQSKYVIPGLINANVHLVIDLRLEILAQYLGRYEDLITEAAQVALRNGMTTVFDTAGPRAPLMAVRDRIGSGEVSGSRMFCAGWIVGMDGPLSRDFYPKAAEVASADFARRANSLWVENIGPDLMWMTPEQVGREVREYLSSGIDFLKYASNDHMGGPLTFSERVQSIIVGEAHRIGVTAQAHTTSVEGLRVATSAGCDIIQHANITGPVAIPESTLELLVKKGVGAVVFPFTDRRLQTIFEIDPWARRAFATVDVNCRKLISSGAKLLLATDAGLFSPSMTSDPRLRNCWIAPGEDNLCDLAEGHFAWFKAMEEKGMAPIEMLRAATRNVAEAYGRDRDIGTLREGKIADLLILSKNPFESSENYRSIETILKDGVIVDRDSLPTTAFLTKSAEPLSMESRAYDRYSGTQCPPCC